MSSLFVCYVGTWFGVNVLDKHKQVAWMFTRKFIPSGSFRYKCKDWPQLSLTLSGSEVKKTFNILFFPQKIKKVFYRKKSTLSRLPSCKRLITFGLALYTLGSTGTGFCPRILCYSMVCTGSTRAEEDEVDSFPIMWFGALAVAFSDPPVQMSSICVASYKFSFPWI